MTTKLDMQAEKVAAEINRNAEAEDALRQIRYVLRTDSGYDTCCERIQQITDKYFRSDSSEPKKASSR